MKDVGADDDADDFAPADDRLSRGKPQFQVALLALIEEHEANLPVRVSKAVAQNLVELTWEWATMALAPDLEQFVQHRKKSTIGVEDVQLAARKNKQTKMLIDQEIRRLRERERGEGTSAQLRRGHSAGKRR
mmetsp:Transcript_74303/g.124013  ORF Transcript_74303/g.124013 Transcript_74303/m.124013 type:complete len:132 (-) Transcript_74303:164-559(-)